ncbi:MAG: hypothetical protein K8T10_21960 [Candidatus Eremiobacteraeota bacterium]|nr:hypothetical protein [Candidatus Eremiobacteraeota bacterium]
MNIWRRGILMRNPYIRTAFRVARVPREALRRTTIIQLISETRRIIQASPEAHTIMGEPVTGAENNQAEKILLDPRKRILEELLHHAGEAVPLEQVRKLAGRIVSEMTVEEAEELPVTNLRGLESWARKIVEKFLEDNPGPDPSFGSLETGIIPPFGTREDE